MAGDKSPVLAKSWGGAVPDAGLLNRAQGCLLGQLAGDSLGSLVEFQSPQFIREKYPEGVRFLADGGTWGTLAGQPTDDSELALLLARTLVAERRFDDEAVARAYAGWYESDPFDIGSTTTAALSAAAQALRAGEGVADAARRAARRSSQANGALMRVSPLGIFGWQTAPEALATWARCDAALTHPHPICQDASAVLVVTLAHAVASGSGAQDVWSYGFQWARGAGLHPDVVDALEKSGTAGPADFLSNQGWVLVALRNAFHRLRRAESLEEGVVSTVAQGGDTDTNAAIAGALLGAVHGRNAVPAQWEEKIVSCRPEAGKAGVRHPRPPALWPADALCLAEHLLAAGAA
ncbi:MAG: ADP-ribosylglycohydrolase family protein [Lentisphaerae bacterium]|nr:ADP-ribosylglycohydrolase family protein [Lentisphaerota bacterium]